MKSANNGQVIEDRSCHVLSCLLWGQPLALLKYDWSIRSLKSEYWPMGNGAVSQEGLWAHVGPYHTMGVGYDRSGPGNYVFDMVKRLFMIIYVCHTSYHLFYC